MDRRLFFLPNTLPLSTSLQIHDPLPKLFITLDGENPPPPGAGSSDSFSDSNTQDTTRYQQVTQGTAQGSSQPIELKFKHYSDFLRELREDSSELHQKVKQHPHVLIQLITLDASQRFNAEFRSVVMSYFRLLFQRLEIQNNRKITVDYLREPINGKVVLEMRDGQLHISGDVPDGRLLSTPSPLPAVPTSETPQDVSHFKKAIDLLKQSSSGNTEKK